MGNEDSLSDLLNGLCDECKPFNNETNMSDCSGCGGSTTDDCAGDCDGRLFARVPEYTTGKCKDPRVKVAQIIQNTNTCADNCICPPVPIPTPIDCSNRPTTPIWVKNGESTKIGCDLFYKEIDTNPCSPTYNTIRLVDAIVINVVLNCN